MEIIVIELNKPSELALRNFYVLVYEVINRYYEETERKGIEVDAEQVPQDR